MSRMLDLTRAWAAITGLVLIALMLLLVVAGYSLTYVLPMLVAGIVGYEVSLLAYDFWRRRRHG